MSFFGHMFEDLNGLNGFDGAEPSEKSEVMCFKLILPLL